MKTRFLTQALLILLLTTLQTVWAGPNEDLMKAAMKGDMAKVEAAVSSGADVNFSNNKQMTPLLNASHMGHEAVIKYLVENGADVNVKDAKGRSALTHAAHKGNTGLIEYLKTKGATE